MKLKCPDRQLLKRWEKFRVRRASLYRPKTRTKPVQRSNHPDPAVVERKGDVEIRKFSMIVKTRAVVIADEPVGVGAIAAMAH
jgi:hypothetical protein